MAKKTRANPVRIRLKAVAHEPDLSEWELDALDGVLGNFKEWLLKAATEAVTLALKDEDTGVSWPAVWDRAGKTTVDPLTMKLDVALGSMLDEHPVYAFNIRAALQTYLEDCREDGSFSEGLGKIRNALRNLADEIDAALVFGAKQ